jgi:hypothetical protein
VRAELQGFKRGTKSGNQLVSDGRLTVDFRLEPGAVSETVEVVARTGESVNTTSGEVARVVDREQAPAKPKLRVQNYGWALGGPLR